MGQMYYIVYIAEWQHGMNYKKMHLAVEGCCHGDLDKIYGTLQYAIEQKQMHEQKELAMKSLEGDDDDLLNYVPPTIDLLLICGDFESIRHENDLNSMSVPEKFKEWKDFYKYFAPTPLKSENEETKVAPFPTLFIGGNHEASLYLMSLPFGGFVTDKIFYLGHTGFVQFRKKNIKDGRVLNLRIGGWSGIFKGSDFFKDSARVFPPKKEQGVEQESDKKLGTTLFDEQHVPFSEDAKRSVYHVRNVEFWKLLNMKLCLDYENEQPVDIFLSHDWPTGVTRFGDLSNIQKYKDHVMKEINESDHKLGNPWSEKLLIELQPKFWFSAHMHCKFSSVVQHGQKVSANSSNNLTRNTKFLALDKCLPRRDFLQMVNLDHYIETKEETLNSEEGEYYFDLDWLAITKLFHAYRYEISNLLRQSHIQKIQKQSNELETALVCEEIFTHVKEHSLPFSKSRQYPLFTKEEIEKEKIWILERSKIFQNGKYANLRIPTPANYSLGNNEKTETRVPIEMDPQTTEFLNFLGFD